MRGQVRVTLLHEFISIIKFDIRSVDIHCEPFRTLILNVGFCNSVVNRKMKINVVKFLRWSWGAV